MPLMIPAEPPLAGWLGEFMRRGQSFGQGSGKCLPFGVPANCLRSQSASLARATGNLLAVWGGWLISVAGRRRLAGVSMLDGKTLSAGPAQCGASSGLRLS
ncbi:MAG: hypothetical protein ACPGLY_11035 [Rubripirellula sp.]